MGSGVSSPQSQSSSKDEQKCLGSSHAAAVTTSATAASPGTIHWAAAWGPPSRVAKLLDNESIRNTQMNEFYDGHTPLMIASSVGNIEICKLLIVAGACTDTVNADGQSACDMAKNEKTKEVFDSTTRI